MIPLQIAPLDSPVSPATVGDDLPGPQAPGFADVLGASTEELKGATGAPNAPQGAVAAVSSVQTGTGMPVEHAASPVPNDPTLGAVGASTATSSAPPSLSSPTNSDGTGGHLDAQASGQGRPASGRQMAAGSKDEHEKYAKQADAATSASKPSVPSVDIVIGSVTMTATETQVTAKTSDARAKTPVAATGATSAALQAVATSSSSPAKSIAAATTKASTVPGTTFGTTSSLVAHEAAPRKDSTSSDASTDERSAQSPSDASAKASGALLASRSLKVEPATSAHTLSPTSPATQAVGAPQNASNLTLNNALAGLNPLHATNGTDHIVASAPAGTSQLPGVASQLLTVLSPIRQLPSGTQTLTIALHPEGLGDVKATMTLTDSGLVVRLSPSTEAGTEALRNALPELRSGFAADPANPTVVLSDGGGQQGSAFSGQQAPFEGQQSVSGGSSISSSSQPADGDQATPATSSLSSTALLDVRV